MKKTFFVLALAAVSAQGYACTVELQYQGTVLGKNIFTAYECRDALRECKIAEKTYERQHNLSELQCVSVGDLPTNPNPYPPTDPNPYPPTDPNPHYTRLQALQAIEAVENSAQDADANLNIILNEEARNVGSLYELTDSFVRMLLLNGGSNATGVTQNMFKNFANMAISENLSMTEIVNAYEVLVRSENATSDSVNALNFSLQFSKSQGISLLEGAQAYNDILRIEGGSSNTSNAILVMQYLTQLDSPVKRNALNYYLEIRALENSTTDARDLLALVIKAIDVGIRPIEAQNSMLSILRQQGSSNTSIIMIKYKNMFRI